MSFFYTHNVKLRFNIYIDAPRQYVTKWLKLKEKCESGEKENKQIVYEWLSYCNNPSIKKMPFLKRLEGGIGGDCNYTNKQLRFRQLLPFRQTYPSYTIDDKNIVIEDITSTEQEKWTIEELDDLILGFIKMANDYIGENCVEGCIELVTKKSLYDDYLY
jgi:hypothetical protein